MIELPLAGTGRKIGIVPTKIIAVGLNYREHVKESISGRKLPDKMPTEPVLFAKTPNVLIGPEDAIVIPALIDEYHFEDARVDLEAELAVVIGKRGRHIPEEKAFDYVLGYTCFNDVSQRNFQYLDPSGWFRGKSLDTFGPIGPAVVFHKDIDVKSLNLYSRINGELKQSGNTGDMIFNVPHLIAFISKHFTLEEGDLIATGTPKGVSPLHPGDVAEIEIEGIGILRNPVVGEKV
jgi:2-keto-4-pentenoate hydratase/2-oxohepta-3-ene-1,7-dioic acid hydratase in catechol pathway